MSEIISINKDFNFISSNLLDLPSSIIIVSDSNVHNLYIKDLMSAINKLNVKVKEVVINEGEKNKNHQSVFNIYDSLYEIKADRNTLLLSFGGGVIGDLTAFAASTYNRGTRLMHIPTTLLSQIDSSIGGKTGLNYKGTKNIIGTFYPAEAVYINLNCLKTLPERQYKSSMGEILKYALIKGGDFYQYVIQNFQSLLSFDYEVLSYIIKNCIAIKQDIVKKDMRNKGLRNVLNLGHTIGHAVESLTNFEIIHGEAVAYGLHFVNTLSNKKGILNEKVKEDIKLIIKSLNMKYPKSITNSLDIYEKISRDKKNKMGKLIFVLPYGIGDIRTIDTIEYVDIEMTCKQLAKEEFLWI